MFTRQRNRTVLSFAAEPSCREALIAMILPYELHAAAREEAHRAGARPIKLNRNWSVIKRKLPEKLGANVCVVFEVNATDMSTDERRSLVALGLGYGYVTMYHRGTERVLESPDDI